MSEETPSPFSVSLSEPAEGTFVVALSGEMDLTSSSELASRMDALRAALPFRVVFDLSGLSFVDSSGLNELVTAVRVVEGHGGWAAVAGAQPNISRLFEIVQLDDIVAIEPSVESALLRAAARTGTEDPG